MDYTKLYKNNVSDDCMELLQHSAWIVCLCGSTRFKELFLQVNRELTRQGAIVLMPGVWGHCGDIVTDNEKERLDKLHKKKIMLADMIYVINPDGYIGESTKDEIAFAKSLDKVIKYFDGEHTI